MNTGTEPNLNISMTQIQPPKKPNEKPIETEIIRNGFDLPRVPSWINRSLLAGCHSKSVWRKRSFATGSVCHIQSQSKVVSSLRDSSMEKLIGHANPPGNHLCPCLNVENAINFPYQEWDARRLIHGILFDPGKTSATRMQLKSIGDNNGARLSNSFC